MTFVSDLRRCVRLVFQKRPRSTVKNCWFTSWCRWTTCRTTTIRRVTLRAMPILSLNVNERKFRRDERIRCAFSLDQIHSKRGENGLCHRGVPSSGQFISITTCPGSNDEMRRFVDRSVLLVPFPFSLLFSSPVDRLAIHYCQSDNIELLYAVIGVLINLTVDEDKRECLKIHNGIDR